MATEQNHLKSAHPFCLAIHGGAGVIEKHLLTPEKEKGVTEALQAALRSGYQVLEQGGTSLDAVEAAVRVMEDSPHFNAGKGSVLTHDEKFELDASIMCGKTGNAGAVAAVKCVKNPVTLARKVMENTEHVMLIGQGAEEFAKSQNVEIVDQSYFFTEFRYKQLKKVQSESTTFLDHNVSPGDVPLSSAVTSAPVVVDEVATAATEKKFGTVGAVALDRHGNIAAATSTGGMTNKKFGRVGDSPIIGAGTFANNETCAVSATGHGEYMIRGVVCYDIAAMMEYKNLSLQEAADEVVMKKLVKVGGEGGVVALDRHGNIVMSFNSVGMYRGYAKDGKFEVAMFRD